MADENRSIKKPIPEITPLNQPFWDGTKAGKLMIQKCQDCGTWVFCPRPVCGDCASDKLEWVEVSGKGKIFSFTVIREVVGQALRGFAPDIPYVTAWIDLDEGPWWRRWSTPRRSSSSLSARCSCVAKKKSTASW